MLIQDFIMAQNHSRHNDIVLINPPLSSEERYGIKTKIGGQTPPNGLCSLAAVARENNYNVEIIDGAALDLTNEQVVEKVLKINPKYVGLTAVTISFFRSLDIAKKIKEKNKEIKILFGGPHITAAPNETFKKYGEHIDVGVLGEGELTLIDLLKTLDDKKSLKKVNGIIFEKNNKIIITPARKFIENLDVLPIPAWDLLPNLGKYYSPPAHTLKKYPAALLVTSRGCPGQYPQHRDEGCQPAKPENEP